MERINRLVRGPVVGLVFFMTIPGLAVCLVVLAALDPHNTLATGD